jgi:UDP-N-acetyl-2-amino-2-deoxyglucuronate dehydrogenase
MQRNFAVIGVAGYVAPRHLEAIRNTNGRLLAAVDPHDSVGLLDRFGFDVQFFREIERFDRFLEKLRRGPEAGRVHVVSICSPNYLHDAHCRLALRVGADAICEKPLVINPWNLDPLEELEHETGRRISTVLQLRLHPKLIALRERLLAEPAGRPHDVCLTYVTGRGAWYQTSWKGSVEKSGGVATNIGIHLFDLLLWLFGAVEDVRVHLSDSRRMSGFLQLERARVRWFLSVDPADLPFAAEPGGRSTLRSLVLDGEQVEFSDGFADLHTAVYRQTLDGRGFGIADVRPATELVHRLRTTPVDSRREHLHPFLNSTSQVFTGAST